MFEGQILVRLGIERAATHLLQQPRERQPCVQLTAQHLGVDEKAHQALGLQPWAVGIGHADADVGLPGVAVQQRLPAGQQDHEQAGLVAARQLLEGDAERGWHPHLQARRAAIMRAATGVVGGQVKHGQFVAQALLPVIELARGLAVRQPLTLPLSVIGIAHGQCG